MKLVLTFQVEIEDPYSRLIDRPTLKGEYAGSWDKFIKGLYEEEGVFWEGQLEFIKAAEEE